MLKPAKGALIGDDEIRGYYGDRAPAILADLDAKAETQIRAGRHGKRYWPAVEAALKRLGQC